MALRRFFTEKPQAQIGNEPSPTSSEVKRWTIRHEPRSPLGAYIKGPATEEIEVAPASEVERLERERDEALKSEVEAHAEVERLQGELNTERQATAESIPQIERLAQHLDEAIAERNKWRSLYMEEMNQRREEEA